MKRQTINLLLIATILVALVYIQPASAGGAGPVNLSTDQNGNHISDVVENEVKTVQGLPAGQRSQEIQNFASRLPVSQSSIALQHEAQALFEQLKTASPTKAQSILAQYAQVSAQLNADPAIATATGNLQSLMGTGFSASSVSTPVSFGLLQKGDILAMRSGSTPFWPWAMVYEHTGNFYGNAQVYESNADGVKLKPLSHWQVKGQFIGLARDNKASSTSMAAAVVWAANKYGTNGRTPYNFNFMNKTTNSSLYCSQLTWKINQQAGVNVDSNSATYILWAASKYGSWVVPVITAAVAPDEIMLSPNVTVYSTGYN